MSTSRRILGGLLVGAGEGIVNTARQRRAEALRRFERQQDMDREERRDKTNRGLLSNVVTDRDGNMVGITRGGDRKDLGITAPTKTSSQDSGLSAGDKRILDAAIDRHTTDDDISGKVTDWSAVEQQLRSIQRNDLAALVASGENDQIDVESAEYREAQRQAEEWADDQAKFFNSDETDFADYGGNRSAAIQAKTMEFYSQMKGNTSSGASSQQGTEDNPYRPNTEADYNAIPSGAIFINPADGQPYRKN